MGWIKRSFWLKEVKLKFRKESKGIDCVYRELEWSQIPREIFSLENWPKIKEVRFFLRLESDWYETEIKWEESPFIWSNKA